jgi:hypothetical protein
VLLGRKRAGKNAENENEKACMLKWMNRNRVKNI